MRRKGLSRLAHGAIREHNLEAHRLLHRNQLGGPRVTLHLALRLSSRVMDPQVTVNSFLRLTHHKVQMGGGHHRSHPPCLGIRCGKISNRQLVDRVQVTVALRLMGLQSLDGKVGRARYPTNLHRCPHRVDRTLRGPRSRGGILASLANVHRSQLKPARTSQESGAILRLEISCLEPSREDPNPLNLRDRLCLQSHHIMWAKNNKASSN